MTSALTAYRDAELIARTWYRLLPGAHAKALVLAAIPIAALTLHVSLQAGPMILNRARQGTGEPIGEYAASYVAALQDGDLGPLGMSVIAAIALAGFISPLTSGGNIALIPEVDLLGVRPSRLASYFISLLTTAFSIIGLFQLMALTLVASLLSVDADPLPAVAIAWATWMPLLTITVAQTWFVEYLARAHSPRVRRTLALTVVAAAGVLLTFSEAARASIGAAADAYAGLLRRAASGEGADATVVTALLVAVTLAAGFVGLSLCRAAQQHPAHVPSRRSATRARARTTVHPSLMLLQITALQVLRHREIVRPTLMIIGLNLAAVWFIDSPQQHLSALLTIPIATGAAWAANMFGLYGPAMTWMATQPGLLRAMPAMTFPAQFALTLSGCTLCWLVYAGRHGTSPAEFAALLLATVAVAALTTRAAFSHSVRHATAVRLSGSGDTVVKPTRAITYTFKTAPVAAIVGALILNAPNLPAALSATVAACCWAAARWAHTDRRWADPDVRADVVRRVAVA